MRKSLLVAFLISLFLAAPGFAQRPRSERKAQRLVQKEARKLLERGNLYLSRRKWDMAIEYGAVLMKLDSSNIAGYFLSANSHIGKYDLVPALNIMKLCDKRFPENFEVTLKLAQLWYSLNTPMEALTYYQKCQVLRPENPLGYFGTSVILYRLERKEESFEALQKGISLSYFSSPYIIWFKGVLLYEKNDYKNALATFQELQRFRLNDPTVNFYIGMCYYKEGSSQRLARRYLLRAKKRGMPIEEEVKQSLAI